MTSNIINKEIDVVHLRSESDLVLETNTQIKLSTNNILINYVPFDEYIRKVVFDTAIVSSGISSVIHNTWTGDVDEPDNTKIDLTTNTSELIVDEIHTSGIFSTHSHINNNVHFINLSAATNVQLLNLSNSSNIIYNHQGTAYSLSNYIYKVINTPVSHTPVTLSPDTAPPSDTRTGIDTLGTYVGNKILTNKLTTTDVTIGGSEPILELNSATAINFMTDVYSTEGDVNAGSNILFGSLSLDSLVKSQLDENGAITIGAAMSSGQDIGMELTLLSHNNGYTFEYDVVFNLYEDDDVGGTVVSTIPRRITLPAFLPLDLGYFTGLSAGNFYTVLGTFTNTRTGTIVENIEVTGGQNIATIRNVVINSVVVKNENTITITFVPHNTYVADWSSSEKRIKFLVSINGYTGEVDTGITQDMSQSTPDQSTKTYDLSLSSIPSYGNSGILRVDETSKKTDSHYINVISNHFEVSTFEMSQTLELTPFTFSAPTNAPSLNINYGSKQLTWTHTNNSIDDKLSTITFELQKDSAIIQNNTDTYYSIQTDSSGIWKVRAKNVYEQASADSNTITIISPSFNIGTISPNGNRTFNIGISNVNANRTYKLEDNGLYGKLPTTGFGTHTSISTNILTVGTHVFQIKLTDELGLYATQTSNTFYINNPSVSISGFTISATNKNYSFSIDSASANVSTSGGYTIYVQIRNGGGSVLSSRTYTNTGNKSVTYSFSYSTTYYLYAYIKNSWGYSTSYTSYGNSSEAGRSPSGSISIGSITWNGTNTFTTNTMSKSGWTTGLPTENYYLFYNGSNIKNMGTSLPTSTTHNAGTISAGTYSFQIKAWNSQNSGSPIVSNIVNKTLTGPTMTNHVLTLDFVTNIRVAVAHNTNVGGDFTVTVGNFQMNKNGSWVTYTVRNVGTLGESYLGTTLTDHNLDNTINYRGYVSVANGTSNHEATLNVNLDTYFEPPSGVQSVTGVFYDSPNLNLTITKSTPATDGNKGGATIDTGFETLFYYVIKNNSGTIVETVVGGTSDGADSVPLTQTATYDAGGTFSVEAYRWNYVYFSTVMASSSFRVVNLSDIDIYIEFDTSEIFLNSNQFYIQVHTGSHDKFSTPSPTPYFAWYPSATEEVIIGYHTGIGIGNIYWRTEWSTLLIMNWNVNNAPFFRLVNGGGYSHVAPSGEIFYNVSNTTLLSFLNTMILNGDDTYVSGETLTDMPGSFTFNGVVVNKESKTYLRMKMFGDRLESHSGNTVVGLSVENGDIPYLRNGHALQHLVSYTTTPKPIRLFGFYSWYNSEWRLGGVYYDPTILPTDPTHVSNHKTDPSVYIDNLSTSIGHQSVFDLLQTKDNITYYLGIEPTVVNGYYLYYQIQGSSQKYYMRIRSNGQLDFTTTKDNNNIVKIVEIALDFFRHPHYNIYMTRDTEKTYLNLTSVTSGLDNQANPSPMYIMTSDGTLHPSID